jgi:integrase
VAVTTWERYSGIVRKYIKPELGRTNLSALTPAHLRRFYARLRDKGLSGATVSLIHSAVHRALRDAKRDGLIARNVAEDAAPAQPRRDASERAFTPEQIIILDKAIVGHQHEQLWRVLLLTGLRVGEAAALRWSDVDLDKGRLTVRRSYRRTLSGPVISAPKTQKGRRTVPLGVAGKAALQAQRLRVVEAQLKAPAWDDLDLVFPNSLGRPFRADKCLSEFKAVLRDAGLPLRRLHDLRHTFATMLFASDVHPRVAQELLGHSRIEMTMDLYTGSVPALNQQAIERLDNLFIPTVAVG